jgi:hypothetical protein
MYLISLRDKNKKLHNPYLFEKIDFLALIFFNVYSK